MKKTSICIGILLLLTPLLLASPTIRGNRGVLRVFAADPELYSTRRPTLFLGFYQGYAQQNSMRELDYGLNLTMLVFERFEFSYLIENLDSDFRTQPLSNEFKLKIVTLRTPFLKLSPIGLFGFPIGGSGGQNTLGGYIAATADLGASRKLIPLRLHANLGYLKSKDNASIPISGALVYPSKYVDFFVESGIPDIDNTKRISITPGVKIKLWGIRVSTGLDFYTEGEPQNKFNFMFSWLGPFSGSQLIPRIGIGNIKGYVYDAKTNEPVKADIILEGDINRNSSSSDKGKFTITELPPGEYTLIASADGYYKGAQETEIERGGTDKVNIALTPLVSSFSGTVVDEETDKPLQAHIAIIPHIFLILDTDSTTGTFFTEIDEGSYEVTVSKDGYKPVWDSVSVFPQQTTKRQYRLKKLDKTGRFDGWVLDYDTEKPLSVILRLDDRTFMLNDTLTGEFASMLEPRNYFVSISKEKYNPIEDTVYIKADSTIEKIYKMHLLKEIKETEKELVITFNDIIFDFDKYNIKQEFYSELDSLVTILKDSKKKITIELAGHTCNMGTETYNLELSRKRANSVKNYLIDKGVDETNLLIEYLGETNPKFDNTKEDSRKKNRRVEIIKK